MPRKRDLLNVKDMLERIVRLAEHANARLKHGSPTVPRMPPAYHDELMSIACLARAALIKQIAKTRKDLPIT